MRANDLFELVTFGSCAERLRALLHLGCALSGGGHLPSETDHLGSRNEGARTTRHAVQVQEEAVPRDFGSSLTRGDGEDGSAREGDAIGAGSLSGRGRDDAEPQNFR